jgi:hypothetical protein
MLAVVIAGVTARDLGALGGPAVRKRTSSVEEGLLFGFVFLYQAVKRLLLEAMRFDRAVS